MSKPFGTKVLFEGDFINVYVEEGHHPYIKAKSEIVSFAELHNEMIDAGEAIKEYEEKKPKSYAVTLRQVLRVCYHVDATSKEEAVQKAKDGEVSPYDQSHECFLTEAAIDGYQIDPSPSSDPNHFMDDVVYCEIACFPTNSTIGG
jgi:hypothetical protein